MPLARFSSERTIWKYIVDHQDYSWTYGRTFVQLRAWARLLDLNKRIHCFGNEVPYEVGKSLSDNATFVREIIEKHLHGTTDRWHPEDHGLHLSESAAAKDIETLPQVIAFLRAHNLPCQEIPIRTQ